MSRASAVASREQTRALRELQAIAGAGTSPLVAVRRRGLFDGTLLVDLRLDTQDLTVATGGMPVDGGHEEVVLGLPASYPLAPPVVEVLHNRFVDHPHVLAGRRLCIYLDPAQEWHPDQGVVGFLTRLWTWFQDATAGAFDERTALYHPVGGVLHATEGTPTVVVRAELDVHAQTVIWCSLRRRSAARLDLAMRSRGESPVPVFLLGGQLSYSAGTSVAQLLALARAGGQPLPHFLELLAQASAAAPAGAPTYFLLAVPAVTGARHLLCGRVAAAKMRRLRAAAQRQGPLVRITQSDVDSDLPIEWCTVSEERSSRTTRRDQARPVAPYQGTHIVVWGCGGLGSWAAEFFARAGAARLTLCDPALVSGGLLIRQDYTETDVGMTKADALAGRLRAVNDNLTVDTVPGASLLTESGLPACNLLVDATVSNSVGVLLRATWATTVERPVVARLVTDRATCTLGLLTVTQPGSGPDPETVDRRTGELVAQQPQLEAFRRFWDPPGAGDEVVPAPGCSTPTFHGSAADLATVCGTLVSVLGPHLNAPDIAGAHLVAAAHTSTGAPAHTWIDCTAP